MVIFLIFISWMLAGWQCNTIPVFVTVTLQFLRSTIFENIYIYIYNFGKFREVSPSHKKFLFTLVKYFCRFI